MILPHIITYTEDEARSMGYVSITTSYEDSEKEIFDKALETLKGTEPPCGSGSSEEAGVV